VDRPPLRSGTRGAAGGRGPFLVFLTVSLVVLALFSAPPGVSAERTCTECGFTFPAEDAVWWGGKSFCGDSCKDAWYERYKEEHKNRCKICKTEVELPGVVQHQGDMIFITVGNTWDGYCDSCREDVRNGVVDPKGHPVQQEDSTWDDPRRPATPPETVQDPAPRQAAAGMVPQKSGARKLGWLLLLLVPAVIYILWRGI